MTRRTEISPGVRVLMVCTGNICRSPMAHRMLEWFVEENGCADHVVVESAGTWATSGFPATVEAVDVLARRGIDLDSHRSQALDPRVLRDADLVVVMTSVHVKELTGVDPEGVGKMRLLKELADLAAAVRDEDASAGRGSKHAIEALLKAPRPEPRRALDLDDPIGLPMSAYERCAGEIEAGIRALADVLCRG